MSSKQPKEDRTNHAHIAPRCLVLALKTKGDKRRLNGRSSNGTQFDGDVHGPGHGRSRSVSPAHAPPQPVGTPNPAPDTKTSSPTAGKNIFESFQAENSGCYWNPHLEESVRNLKFIGQIHPSTLLISGRDIYLDTVRNAFARRVLRPPSGFSLHKVGELEPLEMCLIQQTQFTPLPEALCVVIHELNVEELPATLDSVQERLHDRYKGMQSPPEEIVYETLGSLMKERKIYHTGSAGTGYFIVTPDTYKNGCFNHAHLNQNTKLPTVYIPFLTSASTEMRSISCQTEEKETEEKRKGKLERSQSLKTSKGKDKKPEALSRTTSLRYSDDKAKQIFKDINLKTSDAHQDKDKGEKTSLFTKIFGRGKSRRSATIDEGEETPAPTETEYATFSAQFPPPEWAWYENQTHMLAGKAAGVMPRAHTWHHIQAIPHFDAGTQSEYDEEDYMKPCPLPADINGHHNTNNGLHSNLHVPRQQSSSSHSHDSRSSSFDVSPSPHRGGHDNHKHRHRSSSKGRRHSLRHPPTAANPNEYVEYDRDSHIYCEPSNPPNLYARNIQYEGVGAETSTPVHSNNKSMSLNSKQQKQAISSNGRDVVDSHDGVPHSKSLPSPRPKSARLIRYKELQCPSFCGNDISIEYKGRMPKRNSHFSLSRDSGVNCVGLKEGTGNQQSLKDCKLTVLNNQTGPTNSRSNGALNLSNHNRVSAETTFPVQQDAGVPELVPHSHQDSGFSSPRTDATKAYADYHHHSLPLNISTDSNNRGPGSGKLQSKTLPTKVLDSKPPNTGSHSHREGGRTEKGKENKIRGLSQDSIQITSSEKYPSYGQLHILEETGSSSRSGSSKTTVVERSGDPAVKGGPRGFLSLDTTTPSPSKHDSTYMEIQLVTSDCPIHGDSPRTSHHKDDVTKRHSHGNKTRDNKHHSGQWNHHRLSSNVHHYGNLEKTVNGKDSRGQQQHQNSSSSRLAFLGDCEVVGIL